MTAELPINQVVCGAFPTITREWPSEKIDKLVKESKNVIKKAAKRGKHEGDF